MTPTDIADLTAECEELDLLLGRLPPETWARTTAFFGWSIADQIMHLHQVDDFAAISAGAPARFPALVAEVRTGQAQGIELSAAMRTRYGALAPAALHAAWRHGWQDVCALLAQTDKAARLPWFGPDMSAQALADARQMEVWAHGQDIYDCCRLRRPRHARIRRICELGVRTQGWSFRNRGLHRPVPPEVRLYGPDGSVWAWNEGAAERIEGDAEDFALVVTQRRHVDDTALAVHGAHARHWMEIAQCFAGKPETGPRAGERVM